MKVWVIKIGNPTIDKNGCWNHCHDNSETFWDGTEVIRYIHGPVGMKLSYHYKKSEALKSLEAAKQRMSSLTRYGDVYTKWVDSLHIVEYELPMPKFSNGDMIQVGDRCVTVSGVIGIVKKIWPTKVQIEEVCDKVKPKVKTITFYSSCNLRKI